jgi:hypothetical protein
MVISRIKRFETAHLPATRYELGWGGVVTALLMIAEVIVKWTTKLVLSLGFRYELIDTAPPWITPDQAMGWVCMRQ